MPNKLITTTILTAILLLTTGCSTTSPLQLTSKNIIASGFADSSINVSVFRQSALLEIGENYAIGFYRADGRPVIQLRNHQDRLLSELSLKEINKSAINNGHRSISLGLAPSGEIHVLYNAHENPPWYAVIRVVGGDLQLDKLEAWDDKMTYPQFYNIAGKLLLLFRCAPHSCYQVLEKSGWSQREKFLDASGFVSLYLDKIGVSGDRGTASWVLRGRSPVQGLVTNVGIYWANFRLIGNKVVWDQAENNQMNAHHLRGIPISIINQGSGYRDGAFYYIASQIGDVQDVPNIHLAKVNTESGQDCRVKVSDNAEQAPMIGRGTLSLPVSRPDIAVSEKYVHVMYRQQRSLVIATAQKENVCDGEWLYWRYDFKEFDSWEPSYDEFAWRSKRVLRMMVQSTRQGDADTGSSGEPTDIRVMSWQEVEKPNGFQSILAKMRFPANGHKSP